MELTCWSSQLHLWNGRDAHPKVPHITIDTDASLTSWGAIWPSMFIDLAGLPYINVVGSNTKLEDQAGTASRED